MASAVAYAKLSLDARVGFPHLKTTTTTSPQLGNNKNVIDLFLSFSLTRYCSSQSFSFWGSTSDWMGEQLEWGRMQNPDRTMHSCRTRLWSVLSTSLYGKSPMSLLRFPRRFVAVAVAVALWWSNRIVIVLNIGSPAKIYSIKVTTKCPKK